jgi:hypothetical protein
MGSAMGSFAEAMMLNRPTNMKAGFINALRQIMPQLIRSNL